jgi:hypothetical protein
LFICGVVLCSQGEMRVYLASNNPAVAANVKGEMVLYCDIACFLQFVLFNRMLQRERTDLSEIYNTPSTDSHLSFVPNVSVQSVLTRPHSVSLSSDSR